MMSPIDLSTIPEYFRRYVTLVQQADLIDGLRTTGDQLNELLQNVPEEHGNIRYADGKWSLKEVLVHMADTERIFVYRALSISRGEKANLPGFDETEYGWKSNAGIRPLSAISRELRNIRVSTIDFFESLTPQVLARKGSANNTEVSVLALGYIISGHTLHHLAIVKERYLQK